jgi:hypothetical protein
MFDPWDRGNGQIEIRTDDDIFHVTYNTAKTEWRVSEDTEQTVHSTQGGAFDHVREIIRTRRGKKGQR